MPTRGAGNVFVPVPGTEARRTVGFNRAAGAAHIQAVYQMTHRGACDWTSGDSLPSRFAINRPSAPASMVTSARWALSRQHGPLASHLAGLS